jgi:hypothetical protein
MIIDKSPLVEYCAKMDELKFNASHEELLKTAFNLHKNDRYYGTRIFLDDAQFRANNQLNVVSSISGQQGAGKSLFSIGLNLNLTKIFGVPLDLTKHLFVNPFDLREELYSEGQRRTCFIYDEQPITRIGRGSSAVGFALQNYEHICRKTQNNLTYNAPELLEHTHYFIFEALPNSIERVYNEKCHNCLKYDDCVLKSYSTLCEIPFNLRNGYPKDITFLLKTKQMLTKEKLEVPRLLITFPMPSPEIAKLYNDVKDQNIINFETNSDKSFKKMVENISVFVKEFEDYLVKVKYVKGSKVFSTAPKGLFNTYFEEFFGRTKYTIGERDDWILRAVALVDKIVFKKNEKEFLKYREEQEVLRKQEEERRLKEIELKELERLEKRSGKELLTRKA